MSKAKTATKSHDSNCASNMSDNFCRWMPKNARNAFKVALCSFFIVNTILLSGCGNQRPQESDSVYTKVAGEKHRLEGLLMGGKREIHKAQNEMSIAKDLDNLIIEGNVHKPIVIEDIIKYEPQTNIHSESHLKNLKENYPFMVARVGLDRGIQTLMQWVAISKGSTLTSELNQHIPLKFGISVKDPLTGAETRSINPWVVIKNKYPALTDIIKQMDINLPNIPLKQLRSTTIETFLSVGPQIAEVQFAINDKVAEVHRSIQNTEIYMQQYQELFLERRDLVGSNYEDFEKEMNVYLMEDKIYEANNIAGKMNVIYKRFSQSKKDRIQEIEKELTRLDDKLVDPSRKITEKLSEELMALQMLVSKMLNAEPILTALTLTHPHTNSEGIEKEVPIFLILHDMIRQGDGSLDQKLKRASGFMERFLVANEAKMKQRILESIALLASGDRKYLAPLSTLRQTSLAFLDYRYPGLAKDKTFKSIDDGIADDYGFDIYGDRFADFTSSTELFMIGLVSVSTGLYSNEIRHMKPYKNTIVKAIKGSPQATGVMSSARNRLGESLRKTINGIKDYEVYRNKVFDENVAFKKLMLERAEAGQLKDVKFLRSPLRAVGRLKNYSKLLKTATFRVFPSGLLYGSIADIALMAHFANKNKEYFIHSKYIIQDSVYAGISPYTSGVFAHQEPEGMLPMRLAFMTITSLVLNYYLAWNANFSFYKFYRKVAKAKVLAKDQSVNAAAMWLFARGVKKSISGVFKGLAKALENKEAVGKGIVNAMSSGLLVTFGEMKFRGFDDKLIPYDDFFTFDYWSRAFSMYTQEGSLAFLNLLSFVAIDFILIFAFDSSKLMSNSKMKIYTAGFLGVLLAMYIEKLVKNKDMTTLDHQRLIFEGSYLATISTYKYAFVFGPLYDGLVRAFYKMNILKPQYAMNFGNNVVWGLTKLVFFGVNNLAGNLPFQYIIYKEETSTIGPLEAQVDLHTRGVSIVETAHKNLSISGDIELSENEIGMIQQNMAGFNDKLQDWLQNKYKEKCETPESKLEVFGPYVDILSSVCPQM